MKPTPPLFKHQKATKARLKTCRVFFDQSEPGTGKTRVQIEDFAERRRKGGKPALITATRSTLESAWAEDFAKFAPDMKVVVAYANNREKAFAQDADVYVTNHDAVNWLVRQDKKFWKRFEGGTLINDESTVFKHATSMRSKSLVKIAKHFEWRRNMSGLADPNGVLDLWHQYLILDGGKRLGTSFFGFRSAVCVPEQVGPMPNMVKWNEKEGISNIVAALVKDITIKHLLNECVDMPNNTEYTRSTSMAPKHAKHYAQMQDDMVTMVKGKVLSSVNKAALRIKLLQIACICYDTPVLTARGWVAIQDVLTTDRVWDGEEWVAHEGSQLKGTTTVIKRHGVWMTPEHLVLTDEGWKDGKSSERFNRANVRLPDSYQKSRNNGRNIHPMRALGVRMHMWKHCCAQEPVSARFASDTPAQLRMPPREHNTRDVRHSPVLQMGRHVRSLLQPLVQGLQELGRARYYGMQTVARVVREFLFGHGLGLQTGLVIGTNRQQQGLQPQELSMGNCQTTKQQHPQQHSHQNPERQDDYQAGGSGVRNQAPNTICSTAPLRLDDPTRTEPVYDLINCGPRTRFVVMDENGEPLIVHNSGAVYNNEDTKYTRFDTERYELVLDLVQECAHSVVFFQWGHQREELIKGAKARKVRYAVYDGSTSDKDRAQITTDYQKGAYDVIFAHPKSAAHGLTWVRGTRTIWASPTDNAEWYVQGNRRVNRIGQKNKTETITVLARNTYDEIAYERLTGKIVRIDEFSTRLRELIG